MTSQRSIRTLSSRDTAPAGERVILSVVRCPRRLYKEALGPEFISDDSIPEQGLSSQMRLCSNKVLSSLGFGGLIFWRADFRDEWDQPRAVTEGVNGGEEFF